jgi:hypothetical protein
VYVTVDDAPVAGPTPAASRFYPRPPRDRDYRVLVELADRTHKVIDRQTVDFESPQGGSHHTVAADPATIPG